MPEPASQVRQLAEQDLPAALDLVYSQWPEIPRDCQERMARHDPWRDRQRAFGAFVDGRLVSHARFHYRPLRLGLARLHMVGVCVVVTHPDYRHRGLGHRVMQSALQWMAASHYHCTMLYTGSHPFYSPLGWGRLDEPFHYLPLADVPKLGSPRFRLSQVPIADSFPRLAQVFDRSGASHPISLDRSPEYWKAWPRWAAGNLWFGLLDDCWTVAWEGETPVAYGGLQRSILKSETASIVELCALPDREQALFDIADALLARARQAGSERLELNLPPDHPLVSRLAPLAQRSTDTSAMVRIVDLPALLAALAPELQRRSAALPQPVSVRLESPLGSASLSASPEDITIGEATDSPLAEFTPAGLGALLLGFRSASDLHAAGEIQAHAATPEILDKLFPHLHSHYWQIDHF
jgi:predicted acetyltransferase